jgi:hypothetical protein
MSEAFQIAEPGNRDFLDAIFGGMAPDEYLWTAQFKSSPAKANAEQWAGLEVTDRYENRQAAHTGWNHYFCVSALKPDLKGERRRKKGNFSRLFCVVLDDAQPIAELEPTWVLETSRKADGQSNTQVGYRLSAPVDDVDLAVRIHQALGISGHLGADKNGNNAVRYVRLPWGANTKYDPPHPHRLLHWSPESTVDVMALVAALKLDLNAVAGAGQIAPSVPIAGIIENTEEWTAKARKIAWDGALRTHNDPALGRNQEIFRLGAYAARDRLPEVALEFILQEFAARMRPTNTSGELAPINWINERATIRRGYNQGHADGVPPLIDLSAFSAKPGATEAGGDEFVVKAVDTPTAPPTVATYQFPTHLLIVPGLVGDIAAHITASAIFPQPILALAAALAFCGALFGRKVATPSDIRTNIYTMGVADSASGKEHARKAIKRLAAIIDAIAFIGAEKIASDQGLFALLNEQPSCVCLLDEFGRTLRVLNNDRAPAHLQQLVTTLLELTGSADSFIMEKRRAEHGSDNAPRKIINPNLCLYATTVPGRLYQGLTPDEIIDGFLPRWLVFETDTPDPIRQRTPSKDISPDLIRRLVAVVKSPYQTDISTGLLKPTIIPFDEDGDDVIEQYSERWMTRKKQMRGTGFDALWGRAYEHALRLALIRAAGDTGIIDRACAQWACELTEFLLTRMAEQASANVAANEHEGNVQKVAAFLRSSGQSDLTAVSRKFRKLKLKDRKEILSALIDEQVIVAEQIRTEGATKTLFTWIGG